MHWEPGTPLSKLAAADEVLFKQFAELIVLQEVLTEDQFRHSSHKSLVNILPTQQLRPYRHRVYAFGRHYRILSSVISLMNSVF